MTDHCLCKACGQPLPPKERGGVYLPARKAEIFDFIDKHPGITAVGIAFHVYQDESKVQLVRQHICQINSLLAATDICIGSLRIRDDPGEYRIIRG